MFSKKFIAASERYGTVDNPVPAPLLRKNFVCAGSVTAAEITVCGLGFYELYINGANITKGLLAPYISNPDDLLYYDTYNIKPYLKNGENVIGLLLGNGFLNAAGGYIWGFTEAAFRSAPKLALHAEITFSDSERLCFEADETFKTHDSPILFDDERMGEIYDANKEIPDWCAPNFDDSGWKPAIKAAAPKGAAVTPIAEPIVKTGEIPPVAVLPSGDGFIYDFGVNSAGLCRLKITGGKGQRVDMYFGEVLKDGRLFQENIVCDKNVRYSQHDAYICRGGGTEVFVPHFTYHGFRYVYVTGITKEQACADLLTYLVFNSDLKEAGGFDCSDATANKLQEITRRSTLSNMYYFPTDCPHREKNGWTGDVVLSAEHMLLNLSVEKSLKDWYRNICLSMQEDNCVSSIVPTSGWGSGHGPAWNGIIIYLPYFIYKYRGDLSLAEYGREYIKRYMSFMVSTIRGDGTACYGLGDFVPTGRDPEDYYCPLEITTSFITMDSFEKCGYLFELLGDAESVASAYKYAEKMKAAIRLKYFNAKTFTMMSKTQTAQAMALYFGILHADEEKGAAEELVNIIHRDNDHMRLGVLGGRILFHVLSRYGYTDLAYKMITQSTYPSYGNWVARGATTLWEEFYEEGTKISSLNHHFWGDISHWFISSLGGICYNPCCDNLYSVNICPHFPKTLTHAEAYHLSPVGKITSKWRRNGQEIILDITVPEHMFGKITVSDGYTFEDGKTEMPLLSGKYLLVKDGKKNEK